MNLRRAALRIRGNIRRSDSVLLLGKVCALVLPATPPTGAQAVVRRIEALLVDVEHEIQIICGAAAHNLWQRLQSKCAVVVDVDGAAEQLATPSLQEQRSDENDGMPYLAFLTQYPSPRLLHLFPYELANRYRCVPVGAERGVLTLAASEPLDHTTIAYFQTTIQQGIFQVRCEASMVDDILRYWQRFEPPRAL
ncbi:MAG: hypothetical protein M3Z08_21465 [Chloroflexota bacterium]|nr:hypothetical protein [Chloroflexota bacterium]